MRFVIIPKTDYEKSMPYFTFLVFILYKAVLDFACSNVYQIYSASLSSDVNNERAIVSWITYIILLLVISKYVSICNDMLSFMFLMAFTLNGTGFYSIYPIKESMEFSSLMMVSFFWLLFSSMISFMSRLKRNILFEEYQPHITKVELVIFMVTVFLTLAMSGLYGDFRLFISFSDVYEYRAAFLEQKIPSLLLYLIRFLSAAALPYFFVRFIIAKKGLLVFFTFLLGMFMYGIDGLKTTLMIYIIIISLFVVHKFTKKNNNSLTRTVLVFVTAVTVTILIGCIYYSKTNLLWFNTELYRVFVIPSSIADNYYAFISNHEPLLWRESIMRPLFESPYPKRLSYLLSSNNANANTGLYGDAYANFRIFGLFLYSFLYSLVFYKWNGLIKGKNDFLGISLGFIMVWNSINLPFFTWLLTGGVIMLFLMIKLLYSSSNKIMLGESKK